MTTTTVPAKTETDADGLVCLKTGELPDGEHLSRLWSLIADAQESLANVEGAILARVNEKTDAEVTYELIGQLAVFAKHVRDQANYMLRNLHVIEGSFDDLATLAEGVDIDIPRFDEYGRNQHDSRVRFHDDVAHALGIEQPWAPTFEGS